jgi:hypothetical protein
MKLSVAMRRREDTLTPAPAPPLRHKTHKLISVLIANYNYGLFVGAAIESVLRQSYGNFEIVVCDDGSTDDSRDVIRDYADRYPSLVRFIAKENDGVASALNAAYAASRGDIVSLLDADDLFAATKLQRVVQVFETTDAGLVVNRMMKMRNDGEVTGLIPQFGRLDRGWLREKLLDTGGHWSFAPASGISLSRACAEHVFPIPEELFKTEADSYVYTQAPLYSNVAAIDEPLSALRLHGNNVTSTDLMTPAYAERVMYSIERMCTALQTTATRQQWNRPQVVHNPVYQEMAFIRDYLQGRKYSVLSRDLVRLWKAALRCKTADRAKVKGKPVILSVVSMLPRPIGSRVLQMTYSSTQLRTRTARLLMKRWMPTAPLVRTSSRG